MSIFYHNNNDVRILDVGGVGGNRTQRSIDEDGDTSILLIQGLEVDVQDLLDEGVDDEGGLGGQLIQGGAG